MKSGIRIVALGLGFRPAFGLGGRGLGVRGAGLAPLQSLQLLRRRQIVLSFSLQGDGTFSRSFRSAFRSRVSHSWTV